METFIEQRYKMLSEQYYGTNKYLDNIDKAFQKILDNKGTYVLAPTPEFLKSIKPYLNDIEKNLEELFNFKKVDLYMMGNGTYNAFTLNKSSDPIMFDQNMNEKELGPDGIRYKNKVRNAVIVMYYDLLFNSQITNRMLTAILLHEVGHNFYVESSIVVISKKIDLINMIKDKKTKKIDFLVVIFESFFHLRFVDYLLSPIFKKINDSEGGLISRSALSLFSSILNLYRLIEFYTVKWNDKLRYLRTDEKIGISLKKLLTIHGLTLYKNELFADNFATTYGYGPEIIAIGTMFATNHQGNHVINSFAEKSKIFAAFNDFLSHYDSFILDIFTTRAGSYARMIDQISYLEKNIESAENQSNKKQMLAELDRCKKTLSKFDDSFDILADGSVYKKGQIMTGINLSLFKLTKGGISYNVRKHEGAASRKGKWKNLL